MLHAMVGWNTLEALSNGNNTIVSSNHMNATFQVISFKICKNEVTLMSRSCRRKDTRGEFHEESLRKERELVIQQDYKRMTAVLSQKRK